MATITIERKSRALHGFSCHYLHFRIYFLYPVAASDSPCRADRRNDRGDPAVTEPELVHHLQNRVSCHIVMKSIVSELLKLIENTDFLWIGCLQFLCFIVNLFHVRLTTWGSYNSRAILSNYVESLRRHLFGKNDYGIELHSASDPSASDSIVACRRPDQSVVSWIHFASQNLFHQNRISRSHLVAASGEILSVQHNNICIDSSEFLRKNEIVDPVIDVSPGNVVQIYRIQRIFLSHLPGDLSRFSVDLLWMQHFLERWTKHKLTHVNPPCQTPTTLITRISFD